jgi:hypothetical protein
MARTMQAGSLPAPKVRTNSEKMGHVSNRRKPGRTLDSPYRKVQKPTNLTATAQ